MTDHTTPPTVHALDEGALAQLFTEARTHAAFAPTPVADDTLRRLYQLASLGPTSQNCQPARFVFVATEAGRERLLPHVAAGNVPKVQSAPVTVIVARDTRFYEHMPTLWHVAEARANFESKPAHARETAVRNASLTGAYLLLAARALGLQHSHGQIAVDQPANFVLWPVGEVAELAYWLGQHPQPTVVRQGRIAQHP